MLAQSTVTGADIYASPAARHQVNVRAAAGAVVHGVLDG
jgi:hypothetical protein